MITAFKFIYYLKVSFGCYNWFCTKTWFLQDVQFSFPHPSGSSLLSRQVLTAFATSMTCSRRNGLSTTGLLELWSTYWTIASGTVVVNASSSIRA